MPMVEDCPVNSQIMFSLLNSATKVRQQLEVDGRLISKCFSLEEEGNKSPIEVAKIMLKSEVEITSENDNVKEIVIV